MSLTLKIILALDLFFALLLVVYLTVAYTKLFNRKPEIYASKKENGEEIEVSYEEEKVPLNKDKEVETTVVEKVEETPKEIEEGKEETLTIGSFEDLENQVKAVDK